MSGQVNPLFARRVPEAAAAQLAIVLASATEWNLATLEELQSKKSSSKYAIARQTRICADMVFHCRDLGVPPYGINGWLCSRLQAALAAGAAS